MFVRLFSLAAVSGVLGVMSAETVHANDAEAATVPLTVTLTNVRAGDVPLYISIQTRDTYRSMKGEGGILRSTDDGQISRTFQLKSGGEYAVTIWHDLARSG